MNNRVEEYVEIEYESGGSKTVERIYYDMFPEVIVGLNPFELQEVHFTSHGKGRRVTYSQRPTASITFSSTKLFTPHDNRLHKHDYFELIIPSTERFEMQIESQLCTFNQWDVCILNRSTRHIEHHQPGERIFYIAVTPEYLLAWPKEQGAKLRHSAEMQKFFSKGLRDTLQQNKDYISARRREGAENQLVVHRLIQDMMRELEQKPPGYHLVVRGLFYRLLCALSNPEHYTTEHIDLGADEGFSLAYSAKQVLDKNKYRMTKSDLAEKLNYNAEYINRVFKKHFGKSVTEYNKQVCLRHASSLLTDSDMHIHEMSRQLGFASRTHFYNLFQEEYGCTPADYRKSVKHKQPHENTSGLHKKNSFNEVRVRSANCTQ